MERKIGEVFDFVGVKLRVEIAKDKASCEGCYFDYTMIPCWRANGNSNTGHCIDYTRSDKEYVIVVKVEENKKEEE